MTFQGARRQPRSTKSLLLSFALASTMVVLTACSTLQTGDSSSETLSGNTPEETTTEMALPAETNCPEPEPLQPLVCPPPPKPKPCPVCPVGKIDGKLLVGAVEYVKIAPPGVTVKARIDSGIEITAIRASNIVRFERDGEKWVKFELSAPDGKKVTMERQVLRLAKVHDSDHEKRIVVMMGMTLGALSEQVEMLLDDRLETEYSMLIGRNFLHNNAIVDVGQKFIAK